MAAVHAAALGNRLRDQLDARIADRRIEAYGGLWAATGDVGADRPPMTADELAQLADELTDWYFAEHGGMLLTPASQAMFVHLRANLTTGGSFWPASWKNLVRDAGADDDRWLLLWRQASLLRTQVKVDCGVYFPGGVSTGPAYRPYDSDFLGPAAGAKEWREAFARGGARDGVAYLELLRSERITAAGGRAGQSGERLWTSARVDAPVGWLLCRCGDPYGDRAAGDHRARARCA